MSLNSRGVARERARGEGGGGVIVGRSEGWSHSPTPLVFIVGVWVNAL